MLDAKDVAELRAELRKHLWERFGFLFTTMNRYEMVMGVLLEIFLVHLPNSECSC